MRSPAIKAFSLGIITGSFLTAGMLVFAFPVKADVDDVAYAYAATYGSAVCSVLDEYPTIDGLTGIGYAIMEDGLTARQAGQVIGTSVIEICPRHLGLVRQFMSQYGGAV